MFEWIKRAITGGRRGGNAPDGFTPAAPREARPPKGSGSMLYLETLRRGYPSGEFRCRGFIGPDDDPESFARMMAKSGLRVIVSDKPLGPLIDHDRNPLEEA